MEILNFTTISLLFLVDTLYPFKESFDNSMVINMLSYVFFKRFIALSFTFRSAIYLELIFGYVVRYGITF